MTSRDDLAKRQIPVMTLGDSNCLPVPTSIPSATPELTARQRFNVFGNAIITGGLGTLGLVAARALLQHGLRGLVLLDLNAERSTHQLGALRVEFPSARIEAASVDVTKEDSVVAAVAKAGELGPTNILLCFAGIVDCVHALDMSIEQWRQVIDVNTTGSFLCAQAVAKQMVARGMGGSIIFIASISAHRVNYPQPQAAYNVSKAALLTLKSCLAAEWARYGIRTNSISPGYMNTILNEGDGLAVARNTWIERNPAGRMGEPSELTGAILLLASDAGSYINGADIVVDGGGLAF